MIFLFEDCLVLLYLEWIFKKEYILHLCSAKSKNKIGIDHPILACSKLSEFE